MYRISLLVVATLMVTSTWSQTVPEYTRQFETAANAEEFIKAFESMIQKFHTGKLQFTHSEVERIVQITQQKPFANSLLPAVFAWARTMYGDGRVHEGLTFFMESADRYQRAGNKLGESVSYYEIAIIQHTAENLNEAEKYYRLAIENGINILPYRTNINCLNGLAMILRDRQQTELAALEFRRALEIATMQRDTAWIGILSGNIGSCHMAEQNYDSSLWYYNRNLFFIRRTGEFENEIETYANLGLVCLRQNKLALSKLYLDSAVEIIRSRRINFNDFFNPMIQIHENYSLLYATRGDFEKAHKHFVQYHTISQEKQRKINARSLRQLESVWQFNKNQNEINLLRKINQQQRYMGWAFAVIILLLLGISVYAFRRATRRKKINRQLRATNSELGRLNEVKDMLFSVISHDLRGPIANLRSTLNLLKQGNLTQEEVSTLSGRLETQLETSGGALENILQWAKAQLHDMAVEPSRLRLVDLVGSVVSQLKFDLANKKISVVNEVPEDVIVFVDKDQMEVVVRNLVSIAIKFTPSGGAICMAVTKGSGAVTLTVRDNGIGMTPEQLENLFRPDRHGSTVGTNREKGTGIGLIIAKEMVVANGGTIWAESKPGEGSQFHVTILQERTSE